jgi:KUP system potassium uptake protein
LLTVVTEMTPTVSADKRLTLTMLDAGFRRAIARYGFMEQPNIPAIIEAAGVPDSDKVTYFLGREAVLGHGTGAMGRFAEGLFSYLQRNAVAADRVFRIPPKQVIEIGIQLDL